MIISNFLNWYMQISAARYFNLKTPGEMSIPPLPDKDTPYALYLHIPFCTQLCPYCSFFKELFDPSQAAEYCTALETELAFFRERGFIFDTVYIGGGTPTLLLEKMATLLETLNSLWPLSRISIETNPEHLTEYNCRLLKQAGVNRLSVGVQTFNNTLLKKINRWDTQGSGEETVEKLLRFKSYFRTLNIDMIFNFPEQSIRQLQADLEIIGQINPGQVTYYPLMLSGKKRIRFETQHGSISYPKEAQFYRLIRETLQQEYQQTSAWCFTANKHIIDKHMIDEYIIDNEEYIGIGAGAFSYINGCIYANSFSIPGYIKQIRAQGIAYIASHTFRKRQKLQYYFLLKLFGNTLDLKVMKKQFGSWFPYLWQEFLFLLVTGSAERKGNYFLITEKGKYYLLVLMREFFNGVNRFREKAIADSASSCSTTDLCGKK